MINIIPVEKNKKYNVTIDAMSSDGSGITHIDGYAVFVPGTMPGDTADISIIKTNTGYGRAKLLCITSPSPQRISPPCSHFGKCGGCAIMMCNYASQLEFKRRTVKDALLRIGGIASNPEIIGMENPFRYRNKMIFPFDLNGRWGFYREHSHNVIPLKDCLLGNKLNSDICNTVSQHIKKFKIPVYNEETHKGVLRRVFIRNAKDEIMIVISVNAYSIPYYEVLVSELRKLSDSISGIILNVNTKRTNLVLGEKNITLWGKDTLKTELLGIKYNVSPHSFFQINPVQTEVLYRTAINLAALSKNDILMDIYCGIGTISLTAASYAKSVIGVEIVPQAIADAKINAENNDIKNAEFYCADAAEIVPELLNKGIAPNVVILDPPRKGSDEKTLSAIADARPERVVYVSCNPATLARDVRFLAGHGYSVQKVVAVDMFPHTAHVETVALLQRQGM